MYSLTTLHVTMATLVLASSSISLVERLMHVMLAHRRFKQVDCPEFKTSLGSRVRLHLEKPNQKKQDPTPSLWTFSAQERTSQGHVYLLQHPSGLELQSHRTLKLPGSISFSRWRMTSQQCAQSFCIYWNLLTQQSPKELKQG